MKSLFLINFLIFIALMTNAQQIKLITLDPGHFHAALVQKTMYDEIDKVVHVYAPDGPDVRQHLERINAYNSRETNPTNWKQQAFIGNDFLEKMLDEKKGNVVVISGNNQKKTEYIYQSVKTGFNVLADKPMVIDYNDFQMLEEAFDIAARNNLLLYDIMTERFEITTLLQKEFSMLPEVFGTLEKGTAENPAVTKESVHHLYKYVSENVLTRPAWFLDVAQEGEGIVDVMTHLVDLVQWECFPEQVINYKKDIKVNSAKHWTTDLTLDQFREITKLDTFPDYLIQNISDDILHIYCNGEINYEIKGVHAKTSVTWAYKAPEGTGDTHYSIMKGTKANLIIRQGEKENFKPTLYIEPAEDNASFENSLYENLKALQNKYPGVELEKINNGWEIVIPEKYKEGHEAHFASVTERFLEYLKNKNMPGWEVPNMLAKYYTTTKALEIAKQE